MSEHVLPAPIVDAESAPFYEAAREGRFLIRRNPKSGRAHWYPRSLCPFSLQETEWVQALGRGEIYSYTVMRRADPPFAIAYVRLAEGPVMLTHIVDCDPGALAIGKGVEIVFKDTVGGGPPAPCFRLLPD